MRKILLLIIFSAFSLCAYAQVCKNPYKVVVMGSSTAFGWGPSPASSWAKLYTSYLQGLNKASVVYNIAVYGYTTYELSPDDFVSPGDRPKPDPEHNITKALSYKPDVIILNLGSNDPANGYTLAEQQTNYKRIVDMAKAQGVPVWVSTTQPRKGLSTARLQVLKDTRDWILNYFGDRALDFWTNVATPGDTLRREYNSGDGLHLNNAGHKVLYEEVLAAGIVETLCKEEITLATYTVKPVEDKLQLDWSTSKEKNMAQFIIERSTDSLGWKKVGQVAAVGNATTTSTYTYKDTEILSHPMFYRLNMEAQNGNHSYSKGVKAIPDTLYNIPFRLTAFNVTPKQSKLELQWATKVEKDMKEYVVERSLDKLVWAGVATVPAAGTSNVSKTYSFADDIPKAIYVYYRLNMTDKQGRKFYSDTLQASGLITGIPVTPADAAAVRITPNPVNSQFQIEQLSGYVHQVKIYNQSGALVYVKQDYQKGNSINVSTLPAGMYMVVIDDGKYRLKLMKM